MPKLPDTFCPAKWDELYINLAVKYVYACCKATPVKFVKKYSDIIDAQKINLLNGVRDPTCNYCWQLEEHKQVSWRTRYLENFTGNVEDYQKGSVTPKFVHLSVGNECNFQCTYCNPKFSSMWQTDVAKKPYSIFVDRDNYSIDEISTDNLVDENLKIIKSLGSFDTLAISGGEPLRHKVFWQIIKQVTQRFMYVSTNLSCRNVSDIDKICQEAARFEKFEITVSLDSTGKNAEFTRYGLDFNLFERNFQYLLSHKPPNMVVLVNSVLTSITIRDFKNFSDFMISYNQQYPDLRWNLTHCVTPRMQSLSTLPEKFKPEILSILASLRDKSFILGVPIIETTLTYTPFNNTLYQELKIFLNEFAKRKKIEIPVCLD